MNPKGKKMKLLLFLLLDYICASAAASSTPPSSSPVAESCQSLQPLLSVCVPYVQARQQAPSDDCCTGLEHVVRSNATCACDIQTIAASDPSVTRNNVTLAMLDLPKLCSLAVFDPASTCNIRASSLSPPPLFMGPPTPLLDSSARHSTRFRRPILFLAMAIVFNLAMSLDSMHLRRRRRIV